MTSVSELHHFRVQTPSFLISDGAVEVCSQVGLQSRYHFPINKFNVVYSIIYNYCILWFQLSNLQQQRILVEQLSREAAMQRISVSQAILDIKVCNIMETRWNHLAYHFNIIMRIYEAYFDVLFFRNSSQIGKRTTICWWVFHHKRQTHSGKSLAVSFCKVTTTAEAEEES